MATVTTNFPTSGPRTREARFTDSVTAAYIRSLSDTPVPAPGRAATQRQSAAPRSAARTRPSAAPRRTLGRCSRHARRHGRNRTALSTL